MAEPNKPTADAAPRPLVAPPMLQSLGVEGAEAGLCTDGYCVLASAVPSSVRR